MSTTRLTRGRSRASRRSSVTPKTTRRITSRVRRFIRSRARSSSPSYQVARSARATSVTRSPYSRSACPLKAGISSLRARWCSARVLEEQRVLAHHRAEDRVGLAGEEGLGVGGEDLAGVLGAGEQDERAVRRQDPHGEDVAVAAVRPRHELVAEAQQADALEQGRPARAGRQRGRSMVGAGPPKTRMRRIRFSVSAAVAASWGSSSGRSLTVGHGHPMVGRSAGPDLPARGGLLEPGHAQLARRGGPGTSTTSTSGSPPASTCSSRTCSGGVQAGPAAGELDGHLPPPRRRRTPRRRCRGRAGRGCGRTAARAGCRRTGGRRGAWSPTSPRASARPARAAIGPADLGAAAVAAAVGADQPERASYGASVAVEVALEVQVEQRLGVGQHHGAHVEAVVGGAGVEDADARAGLAAVAADQLHPHARRGRRGGRGRPRAAGSRRRPCGPTTRRARRAGRSCRWGRCRRSARRRRDWRRSSGSRARGQSACASRRGRRDPGRRAGARSGSARGRLRAGRCAARSPRPRCGRRRRACRGCWRRGPTRSWWR